jgi:hypothetical protein
MDLTTVISKYKELNRSSERFQRAKETTGTTTQADRVVAKFSVRPATE